MLHINLLLHSAVNLVVCILSVVCVTLFAVLIQFQDNFYLLYIPSVFLG